MFKTGDRVELVEKPVQDKYGDSEQVKPLKDKLVDGSIVNLREGVKGLVVGGSIRMDDGCYYMLHDISDDLTNNYDFPHLDIMEIRFLRDRVILDNIFKESNSDLVWEREKPEPVFETVCCFGIFRNGKGTAVGKGEKILLSEIVDMGYELSGHTVELINDSFMYDVVKESV